MSSVLNSELNSFYRFISEQLSVGRGNVSPEEALDLWRADHPLGDTEEEDVLAVREALDDMANGDVGVPLDQFDRDFTQRHLQGNVNR